MHETTLYQENERLVYHLAWQYARSYSLQEADREDIEQEGRIGLLYAIEQYQTREELRKWKFSTIAYRHIQNKIQRYVKRTIGKHRGVGSINAPLGDEETELEELLADEEVDVYRSAERRIESHRIRVALAGLTTDEELKLIYRHHAFGVALRKLGAEQGVTAERTRQRIANILRKIRRSRWYQDEYRARIDGDTCFVSSRGLTHRPEQRKRSGRRTSTVEQLAIEREAREETYLRMVAELEAQGLIERKTEERIE